MSSYPFDPRYLTHNSASLNRIRVMELPGAPPEVLGKTGYDLLSSRYLGEQIQAHAAALNLTSHLLETQENAWPLLLNTCLTSDQASVQAAAHAIMQQFGRHLGYLLRTLRRGDPANRAARPEWDEAAWNYWRAVQHVTLGGGLTIGAVGEHLLDDARSVFREAGEMPPQLHRSPYSNYLPLVGAARYTPPGSSAALVLDFGGSLIKRALAVYAANRLVGLYTLPSIPTQYVDSAEILAFFNFMTTTIANTWTELTEAGHKLSHTIPVSAATYVDRDGQPDEGPEGMYASLRQLIGNIPAVLSETISQSIAQPVKVRLLHDGTAAASGHDRGDWAATVMLGTALGVGYQPSADRLLPVKEPVKLSEFGKG
ncbi:MAG TPA: hypothetical protein VHO69_03245 [Phototrophicaceae bacterium]|nr:hypothetical protein [Phototrophicaceae bacterium]